MSKQTQQFQAETKQLLELMIHSLYSHREIFLRELISNASDAIEKLKFEGLTRPELGASLPAFEIRLDTDRAAKTLTIRDNGIGMTRDEVIQNIGTIAHSGTKAFLKMKKELTEKPDLIGQFGVGFYSAFMVADKVTLHTQKAGTKEGVLWESEGTGSYTIEDASRPDGHGTTITLHLREFADEEEKQDFTDPWVLRSIVRKYSDFIAHPIRMQVSRETEKDGKKETVVEDETLNSQKALWLRPASEIKPEEYNEFYHHLSHDWTDPLKTIHFKAEGAMEFVCVAYFPSQKPFDYHHRERKWGLSLYAKRVFIMEHCEDLVPPYLRFVSGMVDSEDLSLNVSREMLQKDAQVQKIRKSLTGKLLNSLRDMMDNDRKNYEKLWGNFGPTLKEGIPYDPSNVDRLKDLLLFKSTTSDEWTSLKEYVSRMKEGQKAIYYISGDDITQLKSSPYMEKVASKGYEVLLLTDHVDEWVTRTLTKYEEKELQSVISDDLDLDTEEEKKQKAESKKESEAKLGSVLEAMKASLKEKVADVRLSDRLTESPVCLVSDGEGVSARMERILEQMGQAAPKAKRILEINPQHPLYAEMVNISRHQQEEWAEILYQQALLTEGSKIENPVKLARQIADLMISAAKK